MISHVSTPSAPIHRRTRLTHPIVLTVAMVALIAASAHLSVPLPVGPVPMTMQSLAVLMAALWAGPGIGAAASITYVVLGIAGLPVFAGGTAAPGLTLLLRPSAGFLFAFAPAAWIAGQVFLKCRRTVPGACAALLVGHIVIFCGGLAYLATFMPIDRAITVGLIPFIAGTLVKIALGTLLIVAIRRGKGESR